MNKNWMNWIVCLWMSIASVVCVQGQDAALRHVEPPFWWAGMNSPKLQVLVHGDNISHATVKLSYPGVVIEKVSMAENPNYLFVDLLLEKSVKPGSFSMVFQFPDKRKVTYDYTLKPRDQDRASHQGLHSGDVIYLLMPDRFVNGDPGNDEVKSLREKKNRDFHSGRHGGDIPGILSKVDYMLDLGVTALWINPLLENDMPEYSYHGYAITDYYKTDARHGTNEDYRMLSNELHKRKMKLIMDMVFNHCGREHWWTKDMPFRNWIHYFPDFVDTNHAMSSLSDPHAANTDMEQMEKGWFVSAMPDLNHDNPFLATYLIQNSIWWIEYAGLDGIRMDTYPYNKKEFMAEWARRVYDEYPRFYLVGETWVESEAHLAFWSGKERSDNGQYNSYLNSITDFPLCFAIQRAFSRDGDVKELYHVLSKDFLYQRPSNNKVFADNHDMDRFYYTIGKDIEKFKLAMTFLLTTRGIPQIFYGSEIIMSGHGEHGVLRQDFPGGWSGDARNAFTEQGRTADENEAFLYLQKILNWRKGSDAIANGALKHFVPYDNVYVYNRKSDTASVLVVINNNASPRKIDMTRYKEVLKDYNSGTDVLSGKMVTELKEITLDANQSLIMELKPAFNAD